MDDDDWRGEILSRLQFKRSEESDPRSAQILGTFLRLLPLIPRRSKQPNTNRSSDAFALRALNPAPLYLPTLRCAVILECLLLRLDNCCEKSSN
jgi:hypothetical protein